MAPASRAISTTTLTRMRVVKSKHLGNLLYVSARPLLFITAIRQQALNYADNLPKYPRHLRPLVDTHRKGLRSESIIRNTAEALSTYSEATS